LNTTGLDKRTFHLSL